MEKLHIEDSPQLRWPLDLKPFEHEGKSFILVADPSGIMPEVTAFPAAFASVLRLLDGSRQLTEVLEAFKAEGLTEEMLLSLVTRLDELYLLENVRASMRLSDLKNEFRLEETREAVLGNKVYPKDSSELAAQLDSYYTELDKAEELAESLPASTTAVICPHIDYHRGSDCYARLHRRLRITEPYDLIVFLGTAHQASANLFHLSAKEFSSPGATFKTNSYLAEQIAQQYGTERCLSDEYLHKFEHSIELQLPFLAHRADAHVPEILPILVSSFHSYFLSGEPPLEVEEVSGFVNSLAQSLQPIIDSGKRVLFYAAVDLSHVGTNFGDAEKLNTEKLDVLKNRDAVFLTAALEGKTSDMVNLLGGDADASRICGYPALLTMLATMEQLGLSTSGELIDYGQAYDAAADLAVSYASGYWSA